MLFNQHVVNVILQHPTTNEQHYYQAALEAYTVIANLTAATISVYPCSEQSPSVEIWTIHDTPKKLKAEENDYTGNTLPLPCNTSDTSKTHTQPQVPPHLPTHTTHLPKIHTHTHKPTLLKHNTLYNSSYTEWPNSAYTPWSSSYSATSNTHLPLSCSHGLRAPQGPLRLPSTP
jgi:hypothetical protein